MSSRPHAADRSRTAFWFLNSPLPGLAGGLRRVCTLLVLFHFAGLFLFTTVSLAAAPPPALQVDNLRISFDGRYKVGCWTGWQCDVTGPAGTVVTPVLRTADPDGQATLLPGAPATVPENGKLPLRGLFRSGKLEGSITVELMVDGAVAGSVTARPGVTPSVKSFRQSHPFWLVVGDQPAFEVSPERWNRLVPNLLQVILAGAQLEEIWSSEQLDGIEVVVLNADAKISETTSRSLQAWVRRGGRLVIPVGDGVAAFAHSPLQSWVPLRPIGQTDLRNIGGLSAALKGGAALRMSLENLPAAELDPQQGRVLATGLTGPLAIRAAYGIGQVTMLAVQLDQPPLSNWESRAEFAAFLADVPAPWENASLRNRRVESHAEVSPTGISDLETQLIYCLDQFEGVSRPSHWVVMGWIALFACLIGPVDYLVLHKLVKRPEWTWFTLPVWIALASIFAISRADEMNARPFAARQIDLVDADGTTNSVRAQTLFGFYSPETRRDAITVRPAAAPASAAPDLLRVSWIGIPEEGFRGMYRNGGIDSSKPSYNFPENRSGIENLPTPVWSIGSCSAEWEAVSTVPDAVATADLSDSGGLRVEGTFSHHLSGEITNWFLAYGDFGYFPRLDANGDVPPLKPGETWDLKQSRSNVLRGRLLEMTSRQLYDPMSRDPLNVARMLTFHKQAGGSDYTKLNLGQRQKFDLSDLLVLHRAVIFGQLKSTPTTVEVDGQVPALQNQDTFVRIILPVKRSVRSSDSAPSPDLLKPRD
ncbi:hypothetical protein [Planctomicrobium sp. SH664]|uniref:hypothetical protein n=1 Tax=Planctomicrobium sp. SH664 TaxID=3448125 RepID=UPI003F5B2F12